MRKLLLLLPILSFAALAQDGSSVPVLDQLLGFLAPLAEAYLGKYGVAIQVISVLGSVKMAIEPVMDLIEIYVKATKKVEDDMLPQKIRENKYFKIVNYVLKWTTSLKL